MAKPFNELLTNKGFVIGACRFPAAAGGRPQYQHIAYSLNVLLLSVV